MKAKNIIQAVLFNLSYNQKITKVAKVVFTYFPSMKKKIILLRDGGYSDKQNSEQKYKNDFLEKIEKEIINRKKRLNDDIC